MFLLGRFPFVWICVYQRQVPFYMFAPLTCTGEKGVSKAANVTWSDLKIEI